MSSGKVNTSEAVIINQVEFVSPVFEPPCHQGFCEKPFEVWARKGCGRSSVMHPPGDRRGCSVLWASRTGKRGSLKKVFYWWILKTAAISELNYEINTREQWQKIKVIEYCRESYRNIKYFFYRNWLLTLYFKDDTLTKWIKAIFEKTIWKEASKPEFLKLAFFQLCEFRTPSSYMTDDWIQAKEA